MAFSSLPLLTYFYVRSATVLKKTAIFAYGLAAYETVSYLATKADLANLEIRIVKWVACWLYGALWLIIIFC
jgi:hypothetical protein